MDATGSMSSLLSKTKSRIKDMMERVHHILVQNKVESAFKLQFVAYRNYIGVYILDSFYSSCFVLNLYLSQSLFLLLVEKNLLTFSSNPLVVVHAPVTHNTDSTTLCLSRPTILFYLHLPHPTKRHSLHCHKLIIEYTSIRHTLLPTDRWIIHRDIKLSNLLNNFTTTEPKSN
jgi:hypothetical protein